MSSTPDDLAELRRDLGRGLKIVADKVEAYETAAAFYDGTRHEVHANPAIARALKRSAEAHPLSFAHIPVDALLDRVELTGLASSRADDELQAILADVEYLDDVDDWHTKAGYFGDYFVLLDPIDEDDDGVAGELTLVGVDPTTATVVYDSRTGRTPDFGVRIWQETTTLGKRWRAAVYYDDATAHLVTSVGQSGAAPDAQHFDLDLGDTDDEDSWRVPHTAGGPLLEHFAVDGRPYGKPLHRKAFGPQDALTKLSASNLSSIDAATFPSRYALMHPDAEADDDDLDEADPDFPGDGTARAAARTSKVSSVAGTIAMLRGVAKVGTFDSAQPGAFLVNQDWYVRAMGLATGTPLFEFDTEGEQPSGEARRRAEVRLVRHAKKVQRSLTATHKRIAEKLLALRGKDAGEVTVTFAPLETATDAEGMELVGKKVANGIPLRDALAEAGYTDDKLNAWLGTDPKADAMTLAEVGLLATALQSLGQAKTLGVVTDAQLEAVLPWLFGAAAEGAVAIDVDAVEPLEVEADGAASATDEANALKAKADALGALVRAGANADEAAAALGINGVTFPNVPTTVRIPDDEAAGLEGSGAPAPTPPAV